MHTEDVATEEDHPSGAAGLAKALAWPVVALFAFASVCTPVKTLLERAGDVLAASSKVSVGTFSVEVQKAATSAGDPELGRLIRGLSSSAIRALLGVGESAYESSASNEHAGLDELERAGLLRYDEKSDKSLKYRLTSRGSKAFVLIVDTVTRQAGREP